MTQPTSVVYFKRSPSNAQQKEPTMIKAFTRYLPIALAGICIGCGAGTPSVSTPALGPPGPADLALSAYTIAPQNPTAGQTITVTGHLNNTGSTASVATMATITYIPQGGAAVTEATFNIPAIPVGDSVSIPFQLTNATAGSYTFLYVVALPAGTTNNLGTNSSYVTVVVAPVGNG